MNTFILRKLSLPFAALLVALALAFAGVAQARQAPADALAPSKPAAAGNIRFAYVDVFVDAGAKPLAAYQLDLRALGTPAVRIVGIEGGEHPAFKQPPYYDPKAIQNDRVILAAFSTEGAPNLPTGRTRVARVHVEITGPANAAPEYTATLTAAADAAGERMPAEVSLIQGASK